MNLAKFDKFAGHVDDGNQPYFKCINSVVRTL